RWRARAGAPPPGDGSTRLGAAAAGARRPTRHLPGLGAPAEGAVEMLLLLTALGQVDRRRHLLRRCPGPHPPGALAKRRQTHRGAPGIDVRPVLDPPRAHAAVAIPVERAAVDLRPPLVEADAV